MNETNLAHYRIIRKLGGGGMGVVYEAEDIRLSRRVALKLLPDTLLGDAKAAQRFLREARAASSLNHPNICTIYEVEEHEGRPFIVMELLEGQDLKGRISSGLLPQTDVLDIGSQIADGLDAAHSSGIVHRDVKPANVFITARGQVKILDFGLAKYIEHARERDATLELTGAGVIPGTTVYMSPEQVRCEELDGRSDLFSLGVVLYEMATGKKPFAANNSVLTMKAILEDKPVSPLQLNPSLPSEFEQIVGRALEKKRETRYQSAADMREDLRQLKWESDAAMRSSGTRKSTTLLRRLPSGSFKASGRRMTFILLGIAGLLLVALLATMAAMLRMRRVHAGTARPTVAVLPFRNVTGDKDIDFLRYGLADETATLLTYIPSLEVRPLETSQKFTSADLQQAAAQLHVNTVLTGHYMNAGSQLQVTVQAIDTKSNQVIWQSMVTTASHDLTSLEDKLRSQIRQGLVPRLGGSGNAPAAGTRPKNPQAYDLYLRSTAIAHDPVPNKEGIALLEAALKLDDSYAPAWDALGNRYYYDAQYSNGGDPAYERSNQAFERAMKLDPNLVTAAAALTTNRIQMGELDKAADAEALVKRRPDSADAHFTVAYVYRYAGLLEAAAQECDAALARDSGDYGLRSCAFVFLELGKTDKARQYLQLDPDSDFAHNVIPAVLLRENRLGDSKAAAQQMSRDAPWYGGLLQTCLNRPADMAAATTENEKGLTSERDPEMKYYQASILAFCGQKKTAITLLRSAIEKHYCASSALQADPLWAKVRDSLEFAELQSKANECQKQFLAALTTSAQ